MKEMVEDVKQNLKNPYYLGLLGVLALATYLRFQFAFFDGMWVDEGRYARIATELSTHLLDYSTIPEFNGQITKFPPVYPYLLAISSLIFGRTEFAIRVVSPLISVLGIGLTYFMGREMADRNVGIAAAALLALNPIFWFLSERILIGATLTTVFTGAVLALYYGLEDREYSKYALWAFGPLVAINIMTKQPGYALGLIAPLYFLFKKKEEIKEVLYEDIEFRKTKFYDTLVDRNYYISGLLGFVTILPWMLRNTAVCGVPLCGLERALWFAGKDVNAVTSSVQGGLYFIFTMPSILTVPVAALLGFRVLQYIFDYVDEDPDMLIKFGALAGVLVGAAYFIDLRFLPMVALTSIALISRTDGEKLLWLWTGIGIGMMSIPSVKVPRYIVFTIPALLILGSMSLRDICEWVSETVEVEKLTAPRLLVLLLVPLMFLSFTSGVQNASMGAFGDIEPAGDWMAENLPEDATIGASSPSILRYYVYPRMAYRMPSNQSNVKDFIREKNISYLAVDTYERTQPEWLQTDIPPYRIPNEVRIQLQRRQISPQEVQQMFSSPPEYLTAIKQFGSTRMPLTRKNQPSVVVYRVNQSGL